jgi:hypothetical protein
LGVGIANDEINPGYSAVEHGVNGIGAAAANANDFDRCVHGGIDCGGVLDIVHVLVVMNG